MQFAVFMYLRGKLKGMPEVLRFFKMAFWCAKYAISIPDCVHNIDGPLEKKIKYINDVEDVLVKSLIEKVNVDAIDGAESVLSDLEVGEDDVGEDGFNFRQQGMLEDIVYELNVGILMFGSEDVKAVLDAGMQKMTKYSSMPSSAAGLGHRIQAMRALQKKKRKRISTQTKRRRGRKYRQRKQRGKEVSKDVGKFFDGLVAAIF